jgi:L-aspartate oxidase
MNGAYDLVDSRDRVVIVGAGLAGLFCALKLAPQPVTLITAAPLDQDSSANWAQGGIAAAIGQGDDADAHTADMIAAGGGLALSETAHGLASEAAARIDDLRAYGVTFDRGAHGGLAVRRAVAHSAPRIVHVRGDMTGQAVMRTLTKAVRAAPSIRVIEAHAAEALLTSDGIVSGLQLRDCTDADARPVVVAADVVVLATGGIGRLYALTTNPAEANGVGLAIAARAGAAIADPEFVQFHPTAMMVGRDPAPIVTQALRSEGAILVNRRSQRFMLPRHPLADRAPSDIVARGVAAEIAAGRGAFLDARDILDDDFAERFPVVHASCAAAGLDPTRQPIPIAPAAHCHVGGIAVDARGRSSLAGLWAAGEVASTGAQGANHLAGNAMLEALVFAARIADELGGRTPPAAGPLRTFDLVDSQGPLPPFAEKNLRELMSAQVGVVRDGERLAEAVLALARLERESSNLTLRNMATSALLIAASAWSRRESRGAHYRADHPAENPALAQRTLTTLAAARQLADELAARPTSRTLHSMSA